MFGQIFRRNQTIQTLLYFILVIIPELIKKDNDYQYKIHKFIHAEDLTIT